MAGTIALTSLFAEKKKKKQLYGMQKLLNAGFIFRIVLRPEKRKQSLHFDFGMVTLELWKKTCPCIQLLCWVRLNSALDSLTVWNKSLVNQMDVPNTAMVFFPFSKFRPLAMSSSF